MRPLWVKTQYKAFLLVFRRVCDIYYPAVPTAASSGMIFPISCQSPPDSPRVPSRPSTAPRSLTPNEKSTKETICPSRSRAHPLGLVRCGLARHFYLHLPPIRRRGTRGRAIWRPESIPLSAWGWGRPPLSCYLSVLALLLANIACAKLGPRQFPHLAVMWLHVWPLLATHPSTAAGYLWLTILHSSSRHSHLGVAEHLALKFGPARCRKRQVGSPCRSRHRIGTPGAAFHFFEGGSSPPPPKLRKPQVN